MKETNRFGKVVVKYADELNQEWEAKLSAILKVIDIPAFEIFLNHGYVTRFIDGVDLQEDKPFVPRHDIVRAKPLSEVQKKKVIKIFKDIVFAGIKTGYTLADFTKRNIIIRGNNAYLIDYDVIIEGPLNEDYIRIFQTMIDYLGIEYKFDGNLEELYKMLGGDVK